MRTPARAEASRVPETISLRALLRRARSDPPRVLAALAALERAEAERAIAQGARFPSLTVQATASIADDNRQQVPNATFEALGEALGVDLPNTGSRLKSVSLQYAGSANLDWSLANVARYHGIEAASRAREAQRAAVSGAQRTAMTAACELYLRALAASQFLADAQLTSERRAQQYQGISGLVKAGLRPPVDETRARIEVVAAKYRLEVRKVEERAAFAALSVSVGREPGRPLRPEPLAELRFGVPSSMMEATALAFDHRPELSQLRMMLAARQAELSAALWRRAPTVGIAGSANASYIDQVRGDGYQGSQYSTIAQAYLRVQSLDASLWRSAAQARASLLQQQRALEATTLDVRAEVAEASFGVERARADLERAAQVLSAAGAAREAQHGRYQAGVASLLELLDAEAVEQNARFERIQTERDHQLASVRLLSAAGLIHQLAQ